MASKSKGIVILGMHRAGTSATGNILVDLGFEMPGESVPADENNPKGYWEPREIVEIHDAFLHGVGRSWSDSRPMDARAFESEAADRARESLLTLADEMLLPRKRWVIKDPRMCRLMPLWKEVLQQPGFDLRFLHVLRSPVSVADSLYRRDKFSQEKSFLLWLRHNLEAEIATRELTRSWLHFEEVKTASPADVNRRFRAATGQARLAAKRIQRAVSEVLEPSLLHSDHGFEDSLEKLVEYPWVATAYRALTSMSLNGGKGGQTELDELRPQILKADAFKFGDPEFWGPQLVNERLHWLRESIENQRREIRAQRAEVDALRKSYDRERASHSALQKEVETRYVDLVERLQSSTELLQGLGGAKGPLSFGVGSLSGLREEIVEWARHQASVADQRQKVVEMLRSSVDGWVRDQVTSQDRQRLLIENLHEALDRWGRRQTELDDQRRLVTDGLLDNLNASLGALGARIHQLEEQSAVVDKAVSRHATVSDQSQSLIRDSLNSLGDQALQLKELEAKLGDFGHWIGELKAAVGSSVSRDELAATQRVIADGKQSLATALAENEAALSASMGQTQVTLTAGLTQVQASLASDLQEIAAHLEQRQEGVAKSLAAIRDSLSVGGERQLEAVESLAGSLNELGDQVRDFSDLREAALGEQRVSLASIAGGINGLERLIVDKLEHKHLALLSKSLEVSAIIEGRWKKAHKEAAELERQRDKIRLALDIAERERDAAVQARDAAFQGRDAALTERRAVIEGRDVALVEQSRIFAAELDRSREKSDRLQRERDAARSEIDQMLGRFSWKLTAPLRTLLKGLKSLRS